MIQTIGWRLNNLKVQEFYTLEHSYTQGIFQITKYNVIYSGHFGDSEPSDVLSSCSTERCVIITVEI